MNWKDASLTPDTKRIVNDKGTEAPFEGTYNKEERPGSYLCRRCGLVLFRASDKFTSSCGWPSFDAQLENNVRKQPDADGRREEILCSRCGAHLGHVFYGEQITDKNTRYCVNSLSLDFVGDEKVKDADEAILAAGCFWGVEYYFKQLEGVVKTEVGYTGGELDHPDYHAVCAGGTGHYEAIRVIFDCDKLSYEQIIKYFFEIHNFEQRDGQGPDIGQQYHSAIFTYNDDQEKTALEVISQLEEKGYSTATKLLPVSTFWPTEKYHQDYYQKQHKQPYCHRYKKIF